MSAALAQDGAGRCRFTKTLRQRFDSRVDKAAGHGPKGDCWVWTGGRSPRGYGQIRDDKGKTRRASRVALGLARGTPLTAEEQACHRCDFPPCVRVGDGHLFVGTAQDNVADMVAKGRNARGASHGSRLRPQARPRGDRHYARQRPEVLARGEANGNAVLTPDAVQRIRAMLRAGESVSATARAAGISRRTVQDIDRGRTWRHLLPESEAA